MLSISGGRENLNAKTLFESGLRRQGRMSQAKVRGIRGCAADPHCHQPHQHWLGLATAVLIHSFITVRMNGLCHGLLSPFLYK